MTLLPTILIFSFEAAAGAWTSSTLPFGAALTTAGCERLSASSRAKRPNVYMAPFVRPPASQAEDVPTIVLQTRSPSVSLVGACVPSLATST